MAKVNLPSTFRCNENIQHTNEVLVSSLVGKSGKTFENFNMFFFFPNLAFYHQVIQEIKIVPFHKFLAPNSKSEDKNPLTTTMAFLYYNDRWPL